MASDWVTRLHNSKALAVQNPNPNSSSPSSSSLAASVPRKTHHHRRSNDNHQIADHLTSALADLFVMGSGVPPLPSSKGLDHRRCARKQPNPRACIPSASASVDGGCRAAATAPSPCTGDNSVVAVEVKRTRTKVRKKRGSSGVAPVEMDLLAFSRTEVTVIDSSLPGWKAEKIIFRKGLVWKVRDRKFWNLGGKKMRLGLVENDGAVVPLKSPVATEEPGVKLAADGLSPAEKSDASEGRNERMQVSARRKKFSGTPRFPVAKYSSVHLKVIPPNKKSGTPGPKGTLK